MIPPVLVLLLPKIVEALPAKVILLLVAMTCTAYLGWHLRDAKAVKELANAQAKVITIVEEKIIEVEKVVKEYTELEGETKVVYKTIYKDAENVETGQCTSLSSEWVSVYNSAVIAATNH